MRRRGVRPLRSVLDMMRLMPCGLLCAGLTGVSAPAAAQTAITFRQAMDMVQQRNERWQAADLSVGRAERTRAEMRGLYWPTVGVVGRLFAPQRRPVRRSQRPRTPPERAQPRGSDTPTQRHGAGERPGQGIGRPKAGRCSPAGASAPRTVPPRPAWSPPARSGGARATSSPPSWWTATSNAGWPPTCWT